MSNPGGRKVQKLRSKKEEMKCQVSFLHILFSLSTRNHTLLSKAMITITQKISLAEVLTGYIVHLSTLDARNLTIPINSIISPTYEEVMVEGEGMPILREPSRKGNLRVKFKIDFPTRLYSDQKAGMKRLLTSS
ncbi:DnaJ homolog subfamily B member 13-like protein [Tanacetum coccineum]